MVGIIIFRDLFVTGFKNGNGAEWNDVGYVIAKLKTSAQMTIIIFILLILGLKGLSLTWAIPVLDIVKDYKLVYNLSLFVTVFTGFTGLTYLFSNRKLLFSFYLMMNLKYKFSKEIICTVFYVGKLPLAPGTFGSLAALICWFFIKPYL